VPTYHIVVENAASRSSAPKPSPSTRQC